MKIRDVRTVNLKAAVRAAMVCAMTEEMMVGTGTLGVPAPITLASGGCPPDSMVSHNASEAATAKVVIPTPN